MSTHPIIAGTDGSPRAERAVDKAGELAQALGAPVHVVCAPGAIAGQDWPPRITAQQIVADASERLRNRGIEVETHLPKDSGDAALAVVAVAEHVDAQMIVVGNKGMTGVRRLLGSLPNTVSHRARCNVLIVPTRSPEPQELQGGTIVVGTDGSSSATQAVKEAIDLAKALGGELHVVSIARTGAVAALDRAVEAAAHQGVDATTHAPVGDPVDAMQAAANETDAAIIVVGSEGMHADERDWFGNISDKISHRGTASVLIVFTGDATEGNAGDQAPVPEAAPAGDAATG
jgi:nucleotide-binding universal stress UspA family protein